MGRVRSWPEVPAFLALSFLCALVSNALAGPTRRLSWIPRSGPAEAAPKSPPQPPPPPQAPASPAPVPQALPAAPVLAAPKKANDAAAPVRAEPLREWMSRFPPLAGTPQADISSDEALWLHGQGALFLDARRSEAYAQGHIAGARCLPAWEDGLVEKVEQLALFTPDLKAPVVIYCSGGDCHDSHLVAQKLWLAGFRNLRIYVDGFPDWGAKGRPVTKGERQ